MKAACYDGEIIVDFRAMPGQRPALVNTAGAPFDNSSATQPPGMPDQDDRLPYPKVMAFPVSSQSVDDPFVLFTFPSFTI